MEKDEKKETGASAPEEQHTFKRDVVAHLIAMGIASVVVAVGSWLLVRLLPWAKDHRLFVIGVGFALFALACNAFAVAYITLRTQRRLLQYQSIVESCGIEGFHALKTPQQKKEGWAACIEKVAKVRDGELRLAVFTGASTFSYESKLANHLSPLREALLYHRGDLKILLMKKGCDAWKQCISKFGSGAKAQNYEKELEDGYAKALDFCDDLAKKKPHELKSIEVREYDRPPLWKMVFMGNEHIWLQHYIPGEHVDDRPAYIVNCDVAGGMAHPLESVFDYRWELSKERVLIHRDEHNNRIK